MKHAKQCTVNSEKRKVLEPVGTLGVYFGTFLGPYAFKLVSPAHCDYLYCHSGF